MFSKFATITCIPAAQESKVLQSGRLNPIISVYAVESLGHPYGKCRDPAASQSSTCAGGRGGGGKGSYGGHVGVRLSSFLITEVHQGTFRVRDWLRKQPEGIHSPCSVTGQGSFLPNLALNHKVLLVTVNFRGNPCDGSLPD